ncbi:RNA polymerase sigma-70 factor [Olivibacter ginsenosidimutans]|uniref:RNA polymerase sigma-70 factor n=1 Tax=Olivibacter ginsenosidimutans TaxID=1176537 RepID=A0ABP9CCU2_9SPHI
MSSTSEGNIINEQVFEQLYRNYWQKVFGTCLYFIRDEEVAAELVQEIFKSLWERRANFQINGPMEHYLVRSAKLKVLEYLRTETRRTSHLNHFSITQEQKASTTDRYIESRELNQQVQLLIGQLSPQCRTIYYYSREQGLSNKEIAEKLQISVKTVEYHISKALHFLREHLTREYSL